MQPLDVVVSSLKNNNGGRFWTTGEKNQKHIISKQQFHMLLKELTVALNLTNNPQSSFETMNFYNFDREVVLRKLRADRSQEPGRVFNCALLEFLKQSRGYRSERS